MEGKSPIPRAQQKLKFQDKVKGKEHCYERYAGLSHIERRIIANRTLDDPKTLQTIHSHSIVSKRMDVNKHDKCISHLPSYLGPSDKGGSVKDKALNVGVLNWDHIDRWKHNQRGVVATATGRHDASSANSNSWTSLGNKLYYESYAPPPKQKASLCSNHSITSTVGFAPGVPNRERIVCLLSPKKRVSDVLTKLPRTERSNSRTYSHLHPVSEEAKGSSSLNLKDDELCINSKERMPARVFETKKILDMLRRSRTNNLIQTELNSETRRTISNTRSTESPNMPKISTISDYKMENKVEKGPNSGAKLNDLLCHQRHEKIIVLLSKDADSTPSEDFLVPESQVFTDEVLGSNQNSSSDVFSCEGDSLSYHMVGISQSPPRPHYFDLGGGTGNNSKTHPNDTLNIMGQPKVSQNFLHSNDINFEPLDYADYACVRGRELLSEHREFSLSESSLRLDQAFLDKAAPNSRNPSPLRQLSNGFSRMRKSLSSKDSSVTAPSNSKRFPASVGAPSSHVDPLKDMAGASQKARYSPLRRLIDPILKPKIAIKSPYADELPGSPRGTKMLDNAAVNAGRFSKIEKKKKDIVRALIQYSTHNGLPMFKLVAKKKGDALVATLANTSAREKLDLSLNITLYSVNEMTNNSSWMYQGRTGKRYSYLCNIVGQMKLCMPSSYENTDVSSRELFPVVESTLFGVQHTSKTDQETVDVRPSGELAALVIKTPKDSLRIGEKNSNREKFLKKFSECLSGDCLSNMNGSCKLFSTTVILPAGVHSMPNKGAPSPLLHRWRSGGSCDCGGWDVGCNLSLLHNEQSTDSPVSECFQLFSQTGAHGKDPSFRLTPFNKGIYSVDFKPSSMSDLQAFFISITVLSSQVAFDLTKGNE